MKKIIINGGRPLKGEVTISGAKNSVVALIPATILADEIVTLLLLEEAIFLLVLTIFFSLILEHSVQPILN